MPNPSHSSNLLDDLFTAVDEGFSYDGIISVPEAGLEDFKHQAGLADSLRGSVVRVAGAAISRKAASVFKTMQRCSNLSGPGLVEKNRSSVSLVTSNQESEDFSDVTHEEASESTLTYEKLSRATTPFDDTSSEMVYGCFGPAFRTIAPSGVTRSKAGEVSPHLKKQLVKKGFEKGRKQEVVAHIDSRQAGLLGEGTEGELANLQEDILGTRAAFFPQS